MFGLLEDLQINEAIDVVHFVVRSLRNGKNFHVDGINGEISNDIKAVADKVIDSIYKEKQQLSELESEFYINELYKIIENKINSHASFERGKMLLEKIKAEDITQKKMNLKNREYLTPIIT
jgi:hypothetical protein